MSITTMSKKIPLSTRKKDLPAQPGADSSWPLILIGTAYHYAPEPSEESFLTRWIVMYRTSSEKWMDLNAGHTVLSKEAADTFQLFNSAARPPIHRYRYPQYVLCSVARIVSNFSRFRMLDNASPFNVPVGLSVDNRHFACQD
ncbi:hypothetical protein BT96DRAFT_597913 [Gymnopus androsaceus JB14]|uniref:Uncharacterized protein n=1 Tax=Gymnopus androsaceus JB14 TaxID=1447944 RepID=A0A6A4HUR3_9AGAR|nr:hypothetical protein BT96DRAFT_597913 [Gymnopus androsaceus JB14]